MDAFAFSNLATLTTWLPLRPDDNADSAVMIPIMCSDVHSKGFARELNHESASSAPAARVFV